VSGDFRVGEWRVAPQLNRIERKGRSIHLEPKVMEVLVCLCQARGDPVSREQLLRQVWPDTFVTDDVLKRCIWQLRRAFHDDFKNPKVIETIAKGGYRLLQPVEVGEVEVLTTSKEPVSIQARLMRRYTAIGLIVGAVLGSLLLISVVARRQNPIALEVEPLSSLPGMQGGMSFSPDGNQLAFSYDPEGAEEPDIYVKIIGDEKPLRLTTSAGYSWCAIWSPDGQQIAYSHYPPRGAGREIMLMTPLGGSKRVIHRTAVLKCMLSWSPDGKMLAYTDERDGSNGIFLMSSTGSNVRRLTTAPHRSDDAYPAFSPDGKQILFVRTSTVYGADIFIVPASGGDPKRVTFLNGKVNPPVWTRDGQNILFSLGGWIDPLYASTTADGKRWMAGIYKVAAAGGEPRRLPLPDAKVGALAITIKGDKLAYSIWNVSMSVWRLSLQNPNLPPTRFVGSQSFDRNPAFSPDGRRIAFVSARDGTNAIWLCNSDGSNQIRLTSLKTGGSPAWSPDGMRIAFDNRVSGRSHIYVISVEDRRVEQVTTGDFDDTQPAWSTDGKWLYFASARTDVWEVWKVSSVTKAMRQVTRNGGIFPQESSDGRYLYYSKVDVQGNADSWQSKEVWRMPTAGGTEELVTPEPHNDWRVKPEGVYFTTSSDLTPKAYPVLKLFSFATGKVRIVGRLDKPAAWTSRDSLACTSRDLAISPDGSTALYVQFDSESSVVMLAKGFQT
jgi:Tol biopolymer transport system component/DNA-binding winged helix-turn-helix (wHTH) protein